MDYLKPPDAEPGTGRLPDLHLPPESRLDSGRLTCPSRRQLFNARDADAAFDLNMTEEAVDRLLTIAPFSQMDAEKFPKRTPLREILRHDASIRRFRKGEIIVRQGDYGTSAFLVQQARRASCSAPTCRSRCWAGERR